MRHRSWLKRRCTVCGDVRDFITVLGRFYCPPCALECRTYVEAVRRHEHLLNREQKRAA